jgi:uncharacterized protein involved in response to NO
MKGSWRLARLFDAPHCLAFAAAALVLGASSLWWALINLARAHDIGIPWGLPPPIAHGVLMTFGFMPMFFIGFLFTAGPKWLKRPPVPARELLPALLPQLAGWAVFMLATHARDAELGRALGAIGLAAVAFGWSGGTRQFWRLLNASRVDDRTHPRVIGVACIVGSAALGVVAWGVATGEYAAVRAATQVGLWGFVGLVFASAAHRMVPFFSSAAFPLLDAWRPQWLLWTFVGVFAFEAMTACIEALGIVRTQAWLALRAGVELPAGIGCVALSVRWGLVQSLRVRLLAMLHVGFTWLGIALLALGVSHALALSGGDPARFGLAPLHAYTMGYLGSTMFAMVTRISCGHSGRNVTTDNFIWRLFWLLQIALAARLAAALPGALGGDWTLMLLGASALGWAAVCVAWSLRYGHFYGTPRLNRRAA